MITLQAIRLDIQSERFQYRLDAPGGRSFLSSDPDAVEQELRNLGVETPEKLIAHVRDWGSVEIDVDTRH